MAMGRSHLHLLRCFLWLSLCTSSLLGEGDSHVCITLRLVKLRDTSRSSKAWNCFEYYPESICERIRPDVPDETDIYIVQSESVCCPGWVSSEQSYESNSQDEDEKELECEKPCKDGFFGQDCKFQCSCIHGTSQDCNTVDGSCDCSAGWTGQNCDRRCNPGFYGPSCRTRSIFTCMNGGVNHPVTGHCLCQSGYEGSRCEIKCGGVEDFSCGTIVCKKCIQNRTTVCDHSLGACRCQRGWKGRYCTEPCGIGLDGDSCRDMCCSGRGYCTDESCICTDGYYGDECQHKCEDGTFGRNCEGECSCPYSCNHVTGACEECPPGFTGEKCTEYCTSTYWGPSCNYTCSCDEEEICDIFTGECYTTGLLQISLLAYVCAGIFAAVLIAGVFLCVACILCKSSKTRQIPEQTGQINISNETYAGGLSSSGRINISNETYTGGRSSSGYFEPSEVNVYSVPDDGNINQEECATDDYGYLIPVRYYAITEALPEKPAFNG